MVKKVFCLSFMIMLIVLINSAEISFAKGQFKAVDPIDLGPCETAGVSGTSDSSLKKNINSKEMEDSMKEQKKLYLIEEKDQPLDESTDETTK